MFHFSCTEILQRRTWAAWEIHRKSDYKEYHFLTEQENWPRSWRVSPIFSTRSSIVLHFKFRLFICFKSCLYVMWNIDRRSLFYVSIPNCSITTYWWQSLLHRMPLSKIYCPHTMWIYFWTLSSISLTHLPLLMQIPCCFGYYSYIISLETRPTV